MNQIEDLKSLLLNRIYDTKQLGAFDIAILKTLWGVPGVGTVEELIEVLKSQGEDNPEVMEKIVGEKAFNLLKTIQL